jgi:hypothetical protein
MKPEHVKTAEQQVSKSADADLIKESVERYRSHQAIREAGKELPIEEVEVGVVVDSELWQRGYRWTDMITVG